MNKVWVETEVSEETYAQAVSLANRLGIGLEQLAVQAMAEKLQRASASEDEK